VLFTSSIGAGYRWVEGGGCFAPGLVALPRSFLLDLRVDAAAGFHGLSLLNLLCAFDR
jgi:hypothetical protein